MRSLTLTFEFLDDGNIAIRNDKTVAISGLEIAKMVATFLTYCSIESNTETVERGISAYEDGLAWMEVKSAIQQ